MTALAVDMTDRDTTYDWTGLTSGHVRQRPDSVELAYTAMIDAWSIHMAMTDKFCDGLASHADIERTLAAAQLADRMYQHIALTWEVSQHECTCHPIVGAACPACTARKYIESGDEMPF